MSNYDEKNNIDTERPCEKLIDRSSIDPGETTNKNEPGDCDFSMNGALIAFMRAKLLMGSDTTSICGGDEEDETPSSAPDDPHPWMRCCARNFNHSVFSLQPSRAPKRGLGRHRRGLSREQHGEPTS